MHWSRLVLLAAAPFTLASAASAQSVTENAGTQFTTAALTTANTFSHNMLGMTITATDVFGASLSTPWVDIFNNGNAYGAVTSMFSIFLTSNTLSTASAVWRLRAGSNALSRIVFNGAPGNTVFDRTFGSVNGTPGSNGGVDFALMQIDTRNTVATYRNAVGVGGNAPVGDLFETLDVSFGVALAPNAALDFIVDTDNAAVNAPLVPVTSTPEPGSLILLGSGLAALGVLRRRRRCA